MFHAHCYAMAKQRKDLWITCLVFPPCFVVQVIQTHTEHIRDPP
jgi:hypothetical protein